jgi:hypothetical protein
MKLTFRQLLPPLPRDWARSSTKDEHSPITLGADITTTGRLGSGGACNMMVRSAMCCQWMHCDILTNVHCAFSKFGVTNLIVDPTERSAVSARPAVLEYIIMIELSSH